MIFDSVAFATCSITTASVSNFELINQHIPTHESPYGRTVFVSNKDNPGIFLLGHLKEYHKTILDTGKVAPGDTVGKVGTSGPSDTEGNIDGKYPPHLHVSYFKPNDGGVVGCPVKTAANGTVQKNDEYWKLRMCNPFDYKSVRKPSETI